MTRTTDRFVSRALRAVILLGVVFTSGCAAMAHIPVGGQGSEDSHDNARRARTMVASADAALRAGDDDKALMEYVAALQFAPEDTEVRFKIGQIHQGHQDYKAALKAFNDVLRLQPLHAGALAGSGLALLRQQQIEPARQRLEQAVAQDNSLWRAYNGLGVIADLQRDQERAQAAYQKALALQPKLSMLHNNMGYSHYLAGDYRMAIVYFERALGADPDNKTAWANLALARVRMGNDEGGVQAFVEIMEPHRAHNNVGYLAYMNGDYERARSHLQQAVSLSPSYYALAEQNLDRLATVNRE